MPAQQFQSVSLSWQMYKVGIMMMGWLSQQSPTKVKQVILEVEPKTKISNIFEYLFQLKKIDDTNVSVALKKSGPKVNEASTISQVLKQTRPVNGIIKLYLYNENGSHNQTTEHLIWNSSRHELANPEEYKPAQKQAEQSRKYHQQIKKINKDWESNEGEESREYDPKQYREYDKKQYRNYDRKQYKEHDKNYEKKQQKKILKKQYKKDSKFDSKQDSKQEKNKQDMKLDHKQPVKQNHKQYIKQDNKQTVKQKNSEKYQNVQSNGFCCCC